MQNIRKISLVFFLIPIVFCHCSSVTSAPKKQTAKPQVPATEKALFSFDPCDSLKFIQTENLKASGGTKSVVFSKNMEFLYAMNLEGMSVMECDQKSRQIKRIFKFKATPGTGWDYDSNKPISSYEEKPVEAFLSHHDSILWVSLHNAEGIVPIHLYDYQHKPMAKSDKCVYVQDADGKNMDTIYVPIIKTGKTPKVIACTSDDRFLLVSNWHSYNVSVLEMNGGKYPYAQLKTNIAVPSIPRGMVIDEKTNKTYVAIMGGSTISVIDNKTWTLSGEIKVASNPRHILQDNTARLFVSFNSLAKVGCVNPANGETLFTTNTAAQPRTMALSKDNAYLFVTCYQGNELQVFKIMADRFVLVNKISCPGKPVGVDIYENNDAIEAWVCSYDTGIISVNRFKKMR
jgi:hypothetical protein